MTTAIPGGSGPQVETNFDDLTLQVVEETFDIAKRRIMTGTVRVSTRTETVDEVAEVDLDRHRVEVTRVPVGLVVDEAPLARSEGDTTIVPVVEERFIVVKQLFLKEELHIRHVVERETVTEPVTLLRQRVTVERTEPLRDTVDPGGE